MAMRGGRGMRDVLPVNCGGALAAFYAGESVAGKDAFACRATRSR
jgi:hypothetical protein